MNAAEYYIIHDHHHIIVKQPGIKIVYAQAEALTYEHSYYKTYAHLHLYTQLKCYHNNIL